MTTKPCPCGSGEPRRELFDARMISCGFACDVCEPAKRKGFRPDVFTDGAYWADEDIDGEPEVGNGGDREIC